MHHRVTEPATFFNGPQHVTLVAGSQFFRQNQGAVKRKFVRCAGDRSYGSVSKTTGLLMIYTKRVVGKKTLGNVKYMSKSLGFPFLCYLKVNFMISALQNFERPMIINGFFCSLGLKLIFQMKIPLPWKLRCRCSYATGFYLHETFHKF